MVAQWSTRAAVLQEDPSASAAQLLRAACLEDLVRDMRARLVASPEPSAEDAQRAAWAASLARIQPYRHSEYGIMFNEGEIMDAVRWRIEDRLGRQRSAPTGTRRDRPKWIDAPMTVPANDPEPFTAGEQLGMFG